MHVYSAAWGLYTHLAEPVLTMAPTKKQKISATSKKHEAETDEGEEAGHDDKRSRSNEHDESFECAHSTTSRWNGKRLVARKSQKAGRPAAGKAGTSDEEMESDEPEECDDSNSEIDAAAEAEKERKTEEYEKQWKEKWEKLATFRMEEIPKRKEALDMGKREKVTYVWNLCTKYPGDYDRIFCGFGIRERGALLVLPKGCFELWHTILLNIEDCKTWRDIRDLGEDVYEVVLNRCKFILSLGNDFLEEQQTFSPADTDGFDMTQVDVFGTYGNDANDNLDYQDAQFPNDIKKIMFDELPRWMMYYNNFYSSFSWNSDIFEFDPKDVDLLLEDIVLGGDSIEHQPRLEDFLEHLLSIGA